ncbi:MAG TPA: exonuclease domain-containing protein [Bacteroidia bacterium]|nr:exonuclease domain-containing protein [Bacteroidia bacterium]
MFAIIDIETCGGKFDFRRGRIIEISILIHDGLTVVDEFTSLINPECNISTYFTNISGITNAMVDDAPKFYEVAKEIQEITKDKIFVAHNVGFDYGFVKEEFASLGFTYKRDTLCTVRLARKLIPGLKSYSLGHLCDYIGIENEARHRARGDAMATAKLFDVLMQLKSDHPQYRTKGIEELMVRRIDKIKQYILDKLPEACGVYYFLDQDQQIIYIGKSTNMYNRAMSHFNSKEQKGRKMLNELYNVDFVKTGNELIALLLENEEIKKHKPKYNRLRKSDLFTHCIDWNKNTDGIISFSIVPIENSINALLSFTSLAKARNYLENSIDEYTLCIKYCGLTVEDSVCFNHQIKKCNGICAYEEEIEIYNKRAFELINKHSYQQANFAVITAGRSQDEKALILVLNNKYIGAGYFDEYTQLNNIDDFIDVVVKTDYYPDNDDIVRSWLKLNKVKIIPLNT